MGAFLVLVLSTLAFLCLWGPGTRNVGSRASGVNEAAGSSDWAGGVDSVPLLLELLGTALESGLTIQGALGAVADVADRDIQGSLRRVVAGLDMGASWHDSWAGSMTGADLVQIHDALSFGALSGASAAPLLYAEAQRCRTASSRSAQKRAAALGVKLVLPLGLCSLPAFIALGIVPVIMAMISEL